MWMFSIEHKKDVFVAMVRPGSAVKDVPKYNATCHIHGDIVTYLNPTTGKWDKNELDYFSPPIEH